MSINETNLPDILTSCSKCVFADYTENVQIGCRANAIDKLKNNGGEIIEYVGENTTSLIIGNRICPFLREPPWNLTFEETRRLLTLKYDIIICAGYTNNIEQLSKALNNIAAFKLKPQNVIVANQMANVKPSEIIATLNEYNINWRLETILENDASIGRYIDLCSLKLKSPYFLSMMCYLPIDENYTKNIDTILYDNLEQLLLVHSGLDFHGMFISTRLFRTLQGNNSQCVIEKVIDLESEQKKKMSKYYHEVIKT